MDPLIQNLCMCTVQSSFLALGLYGNFYKMIFIKSWHFICTHIPVFKQRLFHTCSHGTHASLKVQLSPFLSLISSINLYLKNTLLSIFFCFPRLIFTPFLFLSCLFSSKDNFHFLSWSFCPFCFTCT